MVLEALLSISFSQNHCFPRCHLAMQDVKNNPTLKKTIENNQTEKKVALAWRTMLRASFVLYVPALSAKRMARFKIFMISSAPRSHGIMHICLKRRILSFLMMVCMSWKLQDDRQQKPQQWCQHMGCRNRDPRPQKKDTKGSIKKECCTCNLPCR